MTVSAVKGPDPAGEGARSGPARPGLLLLFLCLADLMVVLDATIVNVALPSMKSGLGMTQTDLQWVVNGYALVFGGFLMLGGRLGDLFGRKRLFLIGVVLFTAASVVNGFAEDAVVLIVGRCLQGLAGALIAPTGLSIINTSFTDTSMRTKALGAWGTIAAAGGALGLLLGGVLSTALSWHWVFFINVPIGVVILLGSRLIPDSRSREEDPSVDYAGAVTLTGGLLLLVLALSHGESWGWTSARTLGCAGAALLLLALFLVASVHSRSPIVRLGIFRIRTLAVADLVLLMLTSGIFSMFFFSSLYLQDVLNYSPIRAGLAFLPAAIGVMVGATLAQPVVNRLGPVAVGTAGLAIGAVGMLLLARLPDEGDYAGGLLPGLLTLSIGLGLAFVPVTLLATSGVPEQDAGLASGLYQTVQEIGGAIGLAVLSALATRRAAEELDGASAGDAAAQVAAQVAGFRTAFLGGAVALLAGAVVFAALLRKRHVAPVMEQAAKSDVQPA
ncbi:MULTISPECIES: MFS transporter [Streptomyces]|uniref:EmrB/QacA subfamily drug resistance transporter n=2 Tax=Streptomyces TaxID=1883 RepID=A0ABT9L3I8_9ACTN|nr:MULTISPECIES: MFS transporter [Streptomyces]MBW8088657.1 MFS transporter [Streptomyces hygroscopicus subsp. hygroscopicus]MCO8301503.1 MFS transporter [Streptomyces sp. RKCA744]MDP9614287.1 EmrB/QacA subfamily drug resistance transporter [Streptomyces demainii]GHJ32142.1 MFS transporter [Streptomyces hygroscopicus]